MSKMLRLNTNIRVPSKYEDKHMSKMLQDKQHMYNMLQLIMYTSTIQGRGQAYVQNVTADYQYTSTIKGRGQAYVQIVTGLAKSPKCYS